MPELSSPGMSSRPCVSSRDSSMKRKLAAMPRTPTGTLMKKIQHQRREGQGVTRDDPLELGQAGPELAPDRRQGDVHDRVVEHDHEQPDGDGAERPPLPCSRVEHRSWHPHPLLASTKLVRPKLA